MLIVAGMLVFIYGCISSFTGKVINTLKLKRSGIHQHWIIKKGDKDYIGYWGFEKNLRIVFFVGIFLSTVGILFKFGIV